jgi:hypothetical protein
MSSITLTVHVSWWVPCYINTLAFMCCVMGTEPDMGKVMRVVERGITLKVAPCKSA